MIEIPNLKNTETTTPIAVQPTKKTRRPNILLRIFLTTILVIFLLTAGIGLAGYLVVVVPVQKLYLQAQTLKSGAEKLKIAVSNKDLKDSQIQITDLKNKLSQLQTSFQRLSYFKSFPYLKDYYQDGLRIISISQNGLDAGEIVIKSVEPYQDFLGLKGSSTDGGKTTEDRIAFLTQSVEGLLPHMDAVEEKIGKMESTLNEIDPQRYPDNFQGYAIKSNILLAKETISQVHELIKNGKPILSKTSWLLGKDKPRTYFLIFQNDAELRPTGGFWTAYGTLTVDKGKIIPGISSDIYSLDALYNSTVPAPRPLKAYHINVPYFNLRDMNLSPDFPTSIGMFLEKYYAITRTKQPFDVVVAIDTKDLVDIVKVLGRIGVPGWGNFSSDPDKRCDGCPQIIYELETIADKPRNHIVADRKGFLGPLMNSLLSNAMGSEKGKIAPLAQAALSDIFEKHVLFYFSDPEIQKAAVTANIAGNITTTDSRTDYFHLNDANMASAKSNLFITQKIKHEIISKDGKVEHKVTITYTNPTPASNCNLEKGDLCLNAAKYRDWFRFYVPAGSQLVKMTGSEVEPVIYDELGKKVFEGFFGNKYPLYAQASTKTSIQYTSSVPASNDYSLLLQKQPGTKPVPYDLWVNGQQRETFVWASDKTVKLAL